MGSAKIKVTVVSHGRQVDGPLQRPVRLTLEGVAGIVYGGLVYPVRAGNIVDLDDASFDKYDCDRFLDADQPIPYATGGSTEPDRPVYVERWHVERNNFGNYLVLDGPESVAETVVDRLEDAGFEVVRWDASHRPADDGYFYDWFIRFRYSGSAAEAVDEIEDLLGGASPKTVTGVPSRDNGTELQQKLDAARAENLALRQQLSEAHANERAVAARLAAEQQTTTQLIEAGQRLQKHVHELRANMADVERTLVRERAARVVVQPRAVAEQLEHDLKRLQSSKAAAEAEWIAAEERAEALQAERDVLRTENSGLRVQAERACERSDELTGLLDEATSEAAESARRTSVRSGGRALRRTPDEFLAKLFRRLSLDRTGVDALLAFPKPLAMVKALLELEENEQGLPGKVIKGSTGHRVMEVPKHVHTGENGNSGMGRLYYARRDDGTLAVLIHRKHDDKEQDRVIQAFDGRIDDLDPALDADERWAG